MSERGTWYFDFISPFAYLQLEAAKALARGELRPCPVLFAGLLKHHGQLGPAEIPSKRRFTYRHVTWSARQAGIELRFPPAHPFNPLPMLRLCLALEGGWDVVTRMFEFVWRQGRDPDADWPVLCRALELEPAQAAALSGTQQVKTLLHANTRQAIDAGVFGVPSVVVDGELFWGADASGMAAAYLDDPAAFEDEEMRRLETLPVAVSRPR